MELNLPKWLPIDGDTRGHRGEVLLICVQSSGFKHYRVGHTNWIDERNYKDTAKTYDGWIPLAGLHGEQ